MQEQVSQWAPIKEKALEDMVPITIHWVGSMVEELSLMEEVVVIVITLVVVVVLMLHHCLLGMVKETQVLPEVQVGFQPGIWNHLDFQLIPQEVEEEVVIPLL